MKEYGEIPGGKNELKPLLYPFHRSYPIKIWSKFRWFQNSRLPSLLPTLNKKRKWLTVIDRLGAPGDALITSNVIRCIKDNYPNLKINCITPHPELLKLDPHIDSINQKETFYSFDSTYWELIVRKEKKINIIRHNLDRLGIKEYEYKARYYISKEEKEWAKDKINRLNKPIIGICTKSKETVKNWPESNWKSLVETLTTIGQVIHLGDNSEPVFDQIPRFAGKCSMRQSAALLYHCKCFIGPDSLLMHVANGLSVPSVIIFGGARPVNCFGYDGNVNLSSRTNCSPCWIHKGYESCNEDMKCMKHITLDTVIKNTLQMLSNLQN